jgi:pyruvate dehydrogenase kinase 2/3/4
MEIKSNFFQRLSDEANELLPIFNKTSTRFYKATVPTGDWSNQVKRKKSSTPVII